MLTPKRIDALAELAGECRHRWDDEHMLDLDVEDRKHTPNWKCKACGMTCCDLGFLEELGDKGCCGYSDFDLPPVGDGTWQPTLEGLLRICRKRRWRVKICQYPEDGSCIISLCQGFEEVALVEGFDMAKALAEAILWAAKGHE